LAGILGLTDLLNPYLGIEEWFEPGREVLIVNNEQDTYRSLLSDEHGRQELGERAHQRFLVHHKYRHRACMTLLLSTSMPIRNREESAMLRNDADLLGSARGALVRV
jgi:spore maturation protein CgeB